MNFTRAGKRAARNRVVGWRRVSDLFVHRRTFHFFSEERRRGVCLTVPPSAGMNRIRFEGTREPSRSQPCSFRAPLGRFKSAPPAAEVKPPMPAEHRFGIWRLGRRLVVMPPAGEKNAAKATERGTPRSDARRHLRARRAALSACVAGGALADRSTASVGTRACKGDGSSRRSQSAGRRSGARSRHGGHYGGARRTRRRTRAADTGRSRSAILRASEGTLSRRACACRRRVRSAADAARAWSGSDRRGGVGSSAAHSETRKETTPAAAVSAARSARKRLRAIHLFLPVADTDRPFDRDRGFSD